MGLAKNFDPQTTETRLQQEWLDGGVYHFAPGQPNVYAVDTPPPTVSGFLHLGHVYSYSQTDFMARFWRMRGYNVFYPMGYDDNGLPTERLVERQLGITAAQVGRQTFIEKCLQVSEEAEQDYQALWQRLGLSIDWRYSYRTIDTYSRRTSQLSFLDLHHKGLVYRRQAPAIWCPECRTAIAQAEVNDLDRESEFVTLPFRLLGDAEVLPIATTRPELLPACVAVFVHPEDARFRHLVGRQVQVPLFGLQVPILEDPRADPQKGTGAVMCCTFGDTTDVEWWYEHHLPLRAVIGRDGRLAPSAIDGATESTGLLAGLPVADARRRVVAALQDQGLVLERRATPQTIRVHERCDTPVEYIVADQWFVRVLDFKEAFLAAGAQVTWHPEHMQARYREWVENLRWDWCISRQRYFGVTFPVWYCNQCGQVSVADAARLPVDPTYEVPDRPCACGSTSFTPEQDVMDTWATSSLTPQIVGRWLGEPGLYGQVFPFTLRPQAHEIIRTWAFYTIVKSHHHFGAVPWKDIAISGWALAPEGMGKISKSRGGGPVAPLAMIERTSADAVRYWAASTGFGKDTVISEEKVQIGSKLVTKLWNVARFCERFLEGYTPRRSRRIFSPADRWLLSNTQRLVRRVTALFEGYDYAAAKSDIETFFWRDLADNYLEMAKQRLYDPARPYHQGALYTIHRVLETTVKLFAPLLPHVTEAVYHGLFAPEGGTASVHTSPWPVPDAALEDAAAEAMGETLVAIATAVRRYKSETNISLGTELACLQLAPQDPTYGASLAETATDLMSITRAACVEVVDRLNPDYLHLTADGAVQVAILR